MKNPWLSLGKQKPYVLSEDEPYVDEFNRHWRNDGSRRINLNIPPTPFCGSTVAPVVILFANPGIGVTDQREQTKPGAIEKIYAGFQKTRNAPFWPLLDEFENTNAGKWWTSKTRELSEHVGGKHELAMRLQQIDAHGYHSINWAPPLSNFPSQRYGFELVRRAIERDAFIIIGRSQKYWYSAIPELRRYPRHVPRLVSNQSAYLTKANLGRHYGKVLRALKG